MMSKTEPTPDANLAEQLQRLLQAIESSSRAILPSTDLDLLQSVVEAAATIFGAEAASIALVDEEKQELEFKVAFNKSAGHSVIGMRIPIHEGIAGHVAMTGQAMAVSNVEQDVRFDRDFAETTGYVPNSILATPLLKGEKVIGVMEVLDKISAASFGLRDMELLAIFAHQAAIAIDQSQLHAQIGEALARGLKQLAEADDSADSAESTDSELLVETFEAARGDTPPDLLELAALFNDIAALGPAERRAGIQVLEVLRQYRRRKASFVL
jgi:GAF domain-containing protein